MDTGHWFTSIDFNPNDWFGFIYRITEIDTGRQYIGKKQFTKIRSKTITGRKNRKRIVSESDWRSYTGSSTELNQMIFSKGKDNYIFVIESLHKTRGSLHYAEIDLQIKEDVLRSLLADGQTRKFYNRHINAVKFLPPKEHSEETKMKMRNAWLEMSAEEREERLNLYHRGDNCAIKRNKTKEEFDSWVEKNLKGENNPMYGKTPHNKGKTFEELYGIEKAESIKNLLKESPKKTGEDHPLFGKPRPEHVRKKISDSNKGVQIGKNNAMYGKPCFYKMSEEEIHQWKNNISNSTKGLSKSEEHKKKISEASKGKPKPKTECPHCGKIGGSSNMKRYHFDNCKKRK